MAAKNQQGSKTGKRKLGGATVEANQDGSASKKPKVLNSNAGSHLNKAVKRTPGKQQQEQNRKRKFPGKSESQKKEFELGQALSPQERRIKSKELAEERKKKRKRHYTLEQELASLWEKMRRLDIAKKDRSELVSEALQKMKGKINEIAGAHVCSRVLQTCIKYCSKTERDAVFDELRPHFLSLATQSYAVFLVKKMLETASKTQFAWFISLLHGCVATLLRHVVGSAVIEHAYELANVNQKQVLLMELYSTELQLFKDLAPAKESRLEDVISKLGLQKGSVLRHMSSVIQPILEKGIVDHSIIHRLLIEYLSIANKSSAADIIQQLSGPLFVRLISTRNGSRLGLLCLKHGSTKERKMIIKRMTTQDKESKKKEKDRISNIAQNQYGCMVLVGIVSMVDDTKLVTTKIIRGIQAALKELVLDKSGRRVLLQLLHPNCSRYLSPDDLESLNLSIPSLNTEAESASKTEGSDEEDAEAESASKTERSDEEDAESDGEEKAVESTKAEFKVGKKDPFLRRRELLLDSGLAEKLVDTCIESAGELLRSNLGKEIIYEAARGGSDDILRPTLDDKLKKLHDAIASLAAEAKSEESKEEHVLENFHSSRTIRKLILDCPDFASTLWKKALKKKCKSWAHGHSSRVVSAFWESSNPNVRKLVEKELLPLIESGILKTPETKQSTNEG